MEKGKITLRELKAMLPPTTGKKLPSPKCLRENATLMVRVEVIGCVMEVYQSGFAVYRVPNHFSVLRMEHVGRALYESGTDGWRSSVNLEDEDWTIGVMICGEERLERQYRDKADGSIMSLTGASPDEDGLDMEIDAGIDVLAEVVHRDDRQRLLGVLTEQQRSAVEGYFYGGMTQEEIAKAFGISRRYVRDLIANGLKKIKKIF